MQNSPIIYMMSQTFDRCSTQQFSDMSHQTFQTFTLQGKLKNPCFEFEGETHKKIPNPCVDSKGTRNKTHEKIAVIN